MKLTGNTIVITGGSAGIGLGLAAALQKRGNTVIVTGRDQARIDEALKVNPALIGRRCDVTREADRAALFEWIKTAHPSFNVLINNAGVMNDWDVKNAAYPVAKVESEIATNFTAPLLLTHLMLPHLLAQPTAAIVNVSSGVAYAPLAKSPVYSATKAALHSFTQSLRFQLKGTPVSVVEVAPGLVQTAMTGARYDEAKTFITPERFAAAVIKGLEKGTPEIRPAEAGLLFLVSRIAPGYAIRTMNKRTRGELPR